MPYALYGHIVWDDDHADLLREVITLKRTARAVLVVVEPGPDEDNTDIHTVHSYGVGRDHVQIMGLLALGTAYTSDTIYNREEDVMPYDDESDAPDEVGE
jgi:hypothetical protein